MDTLKEHLKAVHRLFPDAAFASLLTAIEQREKDIYFEKRSEEIAGELEDVLSDTCFEISTDRNISVLGEHIISPLERQSQENADEIANLKYRLEIPDTYPAAEPLLFLENIEDFLPGHKPAREIAFSKDKKLSQYVKEDFYRLCEQKPWFELFPGILKDCTVTIKNFVEKSKLAHTNDCPAPQEDSDNGTSFFTVSITIGDKPARMRIILPQFFPIAPPEIFFLQGANGDNPLLFERSEPVGYDRFMAVPWGTRRDLSAVLNAAEEGLNNSCKLAGMGASLRAIEEKSPIEYVKKDQYRIPDHWDALPLRQYLVAGEDRHLLINNRGEVYVFNPNEKGAQGNELGGERLDMENIVHMAGSDQTGVFLMNGTNTIFHLSPENMLEKVGTADLPEEVTDFHVTKREGEKIFFFLGKSPAFYYYAESEMEDPVHSSLSSEWYDSDSLGPIPKFYNSRQLFGPIGNGILKQTCCHDDHIVFLIKDRHAGNDQDRYRITCVNIKEETISRDITQLGNIMKMSWINDDHFILLSRTRKRVEITYLFHKGCLIDSLWSSHKRDRTENGHAVLPTRGPTSNLFRRATALNDRIRKLRQEDHDQYYDLNHRISGFLQQKENFWPVVRNTKSLFKGERVNIIDMYYSNKRLFLFSDKRDIYEFSIRYNF